MNQEPVQTPERDNTKRSRSLFFPTLDDGGESSPERNSPATKRRALFPSSSTEILHHKIQVLQAKIEHKNAVIDERNTSVAIFRRSAELRKDMLAAERDHTKDLELKVEQLQDIIQQKDEEIFMAGIEARERAREFVSMRTEMRQATSQNKSLWLRILRDNPDENCPVCCDTITNKELMVFECGHIMHEECFIESVDHGFIDCPLCDN
tara:strand:+ start:82 stop:705 length:624 start_codon:yes stop_codon:yes gene_type:complete